MPTGFFTHDLCHSYQQGPDSPESPERIDAIEDRMIAMGLSRVVTVLPSAPASMEDVLRAHDKSYVQELEQASREAQRTGEKQISEDTFINALSFEAALKSAGAAIEAVRQVCAGTIRNAFACVRPPGHHAGRNFAHGFCLINSVACAALHALDVLGLKRVAIVDFDVHRADGTEDIIKGDDRIALFSLYQETAFPFGLQPAQASNIVNAPMPEGSDGADVLKVVNDVWIPRLLIFKPDLILVSAGFDAHRDEKQALFKLTEFDYSFMTIEVMRVARAVCGGRLVSILEGGYDIRSLARSAIAHITTLTRAA